MKNPGTPYRLEMIMKCSTSGLPVHHKLPEFSQTHAHRVGDAIQPSHPLLSPSPPAPNPSQHHILFQWELFAWGGQSIGVSALASVLPMKTQDWSPLGWSGWTSLQSKGLSSLLQHHSSKASIFWCSAFFTVQLLHPYMTTGKTIALTDGPLRYLEQSNSQSESTLVHVRGWGVGVK